jgi:hypothetical protein
LNLKLWFLVSAFCLLVIPLFDQTLVVTQPTLEYLETPIRTNTFEAVPIYSQIPQSTFDLLENNFPIQPVPMPAVIDQISLANYSFYLTHLSNVIGSRLYGSDGNDEAAEFIAQQFENAGLEVSFHEFGSSGDNVVGKLPGGSILNNQCIVVGAHYDTIPASSKGADDNGSGVAAVLEIARVLAQYQFNYTIYFVAFDEEEIGLYGSQAFADYLHDNDIEIAFVYNFDMIIWDNPAAPTNRSYEIIHNGGESEVIAQHAVNIGTAYNFPVGALYAPGMWMSDHASFWDYNDPAVWFFEYGGLGNPYIHSSADALSQPEYSMELGVQVTKNAAAALADMAVIVSTIPGFPQTSFVPPTPAGFVQPTDQVPLVLRIDDSDLDVTKVELSINEESWIDVTSGLNSTHCTFYWNATGEYGITTIRARVYDAAGWITSVTHTFRVDKGLRCEITSPSPHEQIPQGTQYTIWITASDLDTTQLSYVQVNINNTEWQGATTHIPNQRYFYNWSVNGNGPTIIQVRARDPNKFTNTSIIHVEVIRYLPLIQEVTFWPQQPVDTNTVLVSARVSKHSLGADIYNVQILYNIDNTYWKNRRLLNTEANIFQVTIGPFPAGSQVRFYIEVQDYNDNIVQDTFGGAYYTFVVYANPGFLLLISYVAIIACVIIVSAFFVHRKRKPTLTKAHP